jgi:hypothetical protein
MATQILDLLIETTDLAGLLGEITDLAVDAVPGCASASITLLQAGTPVTIAASDARAFDVDQSQYRHGQGPCLEAARTDTIVRIDKRCRNHVGVRGMASGSHQNRYHRDNVAAHRGGSERHRRPEPLHQFEVRLAPAGPGHR